jgi:hypothetical protein
MDQKNILYSISGAVLGVLLTLLGNFIWDIYETTKLEKEIIQNLEKLKVNHEPLSDNILAKYDELYKDKVGKISNNSIIGRFYYQQGSCCLELAKQKGDERQFKNALKYFNNALEKYAKGSIDYVIVQEKIGETYTDLSFRADKVHNLEKAIKVITDAQQTLKDTENKGDYARIVSLLGLLYIKKYEEDNDINNLFNGHIYISSIINILEKQGTKKEVVDAKRRLSFVYSNIANRDLAVANLEKAQEYLEEVSNILKDSEDVHERATFYNSIGILYCNYLWVCEKNRIAETAQKSKDAYEKSINFFEQESHRDSDKISLVQNNLAELYLCLGEINNSNDDLDKAITCSNLIINSLKEKNGHRHQIGRANENEGKAFFLKYKFSENKEFLKESMRHFEEAQNYKKLNRVSEKYFSEAKSAFKICPN